MDKTHKKQNEKNMGGNKEVDLQLQTQKHFQLSGTVCVCVCCAGIPVVPVQGIPSVPAELLADMQTVTPSGHRRKFSRISGSCLIVDELKPKRVRVGIRT